MRTTSLFSGVPITISGAVEATLESSALSVDRERMWMLLFRLYLGAVHFECSDRYPCFK